MKAIDKLKLMANCLFDERICLTGIIVTFSILGILAIIGSFWNVSQIVLAILCSIVALVSYVELKKHRNA